MKKTRIKLPQIPELKTRDDAESTMTELAQVLNNQRKITALRDAMVLDINSRFEGALTECDQAIQLKTQQLRAWADTNPDQFPKGRKSLDLVSGTLGFRTGTPKLALLSRSWTWDKVLEKLRTLASRFIRTKEEVDKEAILAEYAQAPSPDLLSLYGVKVTQDETFYIEPKLTDTDARQTQEAA